MKSQIASIYTPMENYIALLIEDDTNWTRLFQETIAKSEYNPFKFIYVESIKEALLYKEKTLSLVLLDLMLPDSQGQETINTATATFPNCPIVVLTTLADRKMQEFGYEKGIQDYIVKDEYDEKLFFHITNQAIMRYIAGLKNKMHDDIDGVVKNLESIILSLEVLSQTLHNIVQKNASVIEEKSS